jgi:flagellar protein FliS
MFSSPHTFGSRRPVATAYREVGASTAIDGASPHKLVSLLYGALAADIQAARGALGRGDLPAKAVALSHAVRVVEEGLVAPLDLDAGGELARNLADLYDYLVRRLTHANMRNDDAALAECAQLVATLQDGWNGIAAQVATVGA